MVLFQCNTSTLRKHKQKTFFLSNFLQLQHRKNKNFMSTLFVEFTSTFVKAIIYFLFLFLLFIFESTRYNCELVEMKG